MDIKNSPQRYAETVGLNPDVFRIEKIRASVEYLLKGTIDYEFRTTVSREFHTREDLLEIAEWIRGCRHYYLQQYNDGPNVIQPGWSAYSETEMKELLAAVKEIVPEAELRGVKEG
jgi:pyruvate formate lyase activating enzyme